MHVMRTPITCIFVFYLQVFQVVEAWRNFLQFIVIQMNFSDFGNGSEASVLHVLDLIEVKPQPVEDRSLSCVLLLSTRWSLFTLPL